jgi:hypothetical protein
MAMNTPAGTAMITRRIRSMDADAAAHAEKLTQYANSQISKTTPKKGKMLAR